MPLVLIIALPTPLRQSFEYLPPADDAAGFNEDLLQPGIRVRVPFGAQTMTGVLLATTRQPSYPIEKLRALHSVLDKKPVFTPETLSLCQWAADYYQHPIGEVLHAALPGQLRKDKPAPQKEVWLWTHTTEGKGLPHHGLRRGSKQQLLHQLLLQQGSVSGDQLKQEGIGRTVVEALEEKKLIVRRASSTVPRHPTDPLSVLAGTPQSLNPEQQEALDQIRYHEFNGYLLEGITGSGKTEVYLHAIARTLQAGRQALVLVPEIGLTPQTLRRFRNRFAVPIVELHSSVAAGQRALNWLQASSGEARIVIGTRLAVFTPMDNLGIIIIDEEHDLSFKQQDGLRYSARDLAVVRAYRQHIPLLLGTATPSLESLHNADTGRYQHLRLTQRAGNAAAPTIELLDMRKESVNQGLGQTSLEAIKRTVAKGEQVLLFLNRRGFAPALLCQHCGWSATCKSCDARMILHSQPRHLRCHHCDAQQPIPRQCPSCFNPELSAMGQGTERCEETLRAMFPAVDVVRVDQDSMQRKDAMANLTRQLAEGKPTILVGTQMLAKGHHFPMVTLVVLMDVDQGLFSGDFRGPERMGQQIIQVAGRAGRSDLTGRVILQTHQPDHPLLQLLLREGYPPFARQLLNERSITRLPPVWHLALFRAEAKRAENAQAFLKLAAQLAKQFCPPSPDNHYLGPIPSLMERRNERFRFQLQLSFAKRGDLQALLRQLVDALYRHALARRCRWSLDVDPQDMS